MKKLRTTCFDRKKHLWEKRGENTGGDVLWCSRCGSLGDYGEENNGTITVTDLPEISKTLTFNNNEGV